MVYWDEPSAVDMPAVLADDRVVETLQLGRTPAHASPLITLLVAWRDMCRGTGTSRAA